MKGRSIGMILLAVYLILVGIVSVIPMLHMDLGIVVPLVALAAGIFLLIGK